MGCKTGDYAPITDHSNAIAVITIGYLHNGALVVAFVSVIEK